nr:MAG: hypothetical protein DIU60_25145 [Actinomycetota bacterium]
MTTTDIDYERAVMRTVVNHIATARGLTPPWPAHTTTDLPGWLHRRLTNSPATWDVVQLGEIRQRLIPTHRRDTHGVVYTPPEIAGHMVRAALDANPSTFIVNVRRARRRFFAFWHEGETPRGAWGTDRRVGARARTGTLPGKGNRQPVTRLVKKRKGRPRQQPVHGRVSTYTNHGCRCEPCTRAQAEAAAARRRAKGVSPRRRITADQLEQIRQRRAAMSPDPLDVRTWDEYPRAPHAASQP